MIIRILNFFVAFLFAFNLKYGLRWFRRTTPKSHFKKKQNDNDDILPIKRDWTNLKHINKISELSDKNMLSGHVEIMNIHRLKIPSSDWSNVLTAITVLVAVLNVTSRSFSTSNTYSWYSLFIIAATCIVLQFNAEANLLSLLQDLQIMLFRLLPYRVISRLWGQMCSLYVMPSFRPYLYKFYIKIYGVNFEEAAVSDLKHYRTLGDFFCRHVKPELRPIHNEAQIVSPVDGTVIYSDVLYNGTIQQVKGINYSIRKFLGPLESDHGDTCLQTYAKSLMSNTEENDLYCSVIYLAAGDYHRFHSPTRWRMVHRRHFAGDLLSVNPRFLSWISDLFVLNERVVMKGSWQHGYFSMTAVGATNVGSIVLHDDENLLTNCPNAVKSTFFDRSFDNGGVGYTKGDEVGMFKLGSTVVLIFEAPKNASFCQQPGERIKFGEKLF